MDNPVQPSRELVALSLGSNISNRERYLSMARAYLESGGALRVYRASSLYETEPVEGPAQPYYLNQVLLVQTSLEPGLLLAHCKRVETLLGRHRREHHGPRTLDVDILFYGSRVIATPILTLPHPALPNRKCVLIPLRELQIGWVHPRLGQGVQGLLERCTDASQVRLILPELEDEG